MKKLKYLLFILPFLFTFNVFAKEVDVTSNCYGTTGYASMYSGDEVQYQTYSNYNFGTTYQYQLSSFETELRYNLDSNTDYTITFNTNNSNDFRNNFKTYNVYDLNNNDNNLITDFTFVSMKKVQISFKTTTATNRVKIQMGGSNVYDNITGETTWNIKNAILTIPDSAPSGTTNQDIINNATNNTNTIVGNIIQNTQDIINNANQNSQNIVDNQNQLLGNCYKNLYNKNDITRGKWLTSDNWINDDNSWSYSNFISITPNTNYTSLYYGNSGSAASIVFYDSNKNFISGITHNDRNVISWTSPSNAYYVRDSVPLVSINQFMIIKGTHSNFEYLSFNQEKCYSKLDDTTNAINETNNYLKDDTDPTISDSELNDVFGRVHFTDPLSYLLTLPTQLINKIVSMSDTCSAVDLGTLYGVHLILPCINLSNILGNELWTILDVILSVGLLSVILKNFYDTISNLLTLGGEKEAKEKFSMPTPMDFLAMILGGDNR